MAEVSSTRLYLGNLPRNATKEDVEKHFASHGTGVIKEIKIMNGFGFIEYEDAMDARDVVPAFHGTELLGERLTVQFARGNRPREHNHNVPTERANGPRPRRTQYRMQISGLPNETSWQDLKDFARQSGLDVVYSETGRDRDGKGFVEFETARDLATAVEKLDNREFKNARVTCVADTQAEVPTGNDRRRSRSPGRGPRYPVDDYDRRGPPRGYSPRGYRDRSPPPRRDYYDDRRYGRSPLRRGPIDDFRRGPYDDPYRRDYPPPPPLDPYMNGRGPYDRPPPRDYPPPREVMYRGEYDRGRY